MLWCKLLQNTICCGTLHFKSYRLYVGKVTTATYALNNLLRTEFAEEEV
jgi:hypothetical protein